jgi:hypothetical protein
MGRARAKKYEEHAEQASNEESISKLPPPLSTPNTSAPTVRKPFSTLTTAEYLELLHPPDGRGIAFLSRTYPPNEVFDDWHWRDQGVLPANLVAEGTVFAQGTDRYVAMNRFKTYRRESHLVEISCHYVDVDYHRIKRCANDTPEQALHRCLMQLRDQCLPAPSIALSSGRGLLLVWLHSPIPARALPRWRAVQRALCNSIKGLGVDRSAETVTKVFRIVGSKNRENTVRAIFPRTLDGVVRWDFDTLATEILPLTRRQLTKKRTARKKRAGPPLVTKLQPSKPANFSRFWQAVTDEVHRIRRHRFGDGLIPKGQRDIFLFLLSMCAAWLLPCKELNAHVETLVRTHARWTGRDVRARMCSVIKRAQMSARGEKIIFRGRRVDPRYRFMGSTIAAWLDVTASEAASLHLNLVLPAELKSERRREAVRAHRNRNGGVTRESRRARRLELAAQISALVGNGMPLRAAARTLKISPGSAHAIQREFRQKK